MTLMKPALIAAICLSGTTLVGTAQAQYLPYPSYPSYPAYPAYQAPVPPAPWNYNPYTSGFGPCPQRMPNDSLSCRDQMPPSYGQPSYRTVR